MHPLMISESLVTIDLITTEGLKQDIQRIKDVFPALKWSYNGPNQYGGIETNSSHGSIGASVWLVTKDLISTEGLIRQDFKAGTVI